MKEKVIMENTSSLSIKDLVDLLNLVEYAEKNGAYSEFTFISEKVTELKKKVVNFVNSASANAASANNTNRQENTSSVNTTNTTNTTNMANTTNIEKVQENETGRERKNRRK
jgi:hypothetical protein